MRNLNVWKRPRMCAKAVFWFRSVRLSLLPLLCLIDVQYCSKDCQQDHWSVHKSDCKSPLMKDTWRPCWAVEARQPSFITNKKEGPLIDSISHGRKKYLWGNVQAIDLLNLQRNEGVDYAEDLRLLFAGDHLFVVLYPSLTLRQRLGT